MFAKIPEALHGLKDGLVDEMTKKVSQGVKDFTGGAVHLDSILKGQVRIDANAYIDKLLAKLSQKLKFDEISSISLPNHKMDFEKSIFCGIVIPGQVELVQGFINQLSDLQRMGEAGLELNAFSEPMISTRAVLGIKEATVGSLANVTLACLSADDAKVTGGLKDITLTILLTVSRSFEVSLEKFDVDNTGSLTLGYENLGSFDFLEETIGGDLESRVKQGVRDYLQKTVKDYVSQLTQSLPLSI